MLIVLFGSVSSWKTVSNLNLSPSIDHIFQDPRISSLPPELLVGLCLEMSVPAAWLWSWEWISYLILYHMPVPWAPLPWWLCCGWVASIMSTWGLSLTVLLSLYCTQVLLILALSVLKACTYLLTISILYFKTLRWVDFQMVKVCGGRDRRTQRY